MPFFEAAFDLFGGGMVTVGLHDDAKGRINYIDVERLDGSGPLPDPAVLKTPASFVFASETILADD